MLYITNPYDVTELDKTTTNSTLNMENEFRDNDDAFDCSATRQLGSKCRQLLGDNFTLLLSGNHDLKAVKVRKTGSLFLC